MGVMAINMQFSDRVGFFALETDVANEMISLRASGGHG